jgi:hypothetical protein
LLRYRDSSTALRCSGGSVGLPGKKGHPPGSASREPASHDVKDDAIDALNADRITDELDGDASNA